jgi:CMP-N,N'-diacetyllegionaminic acid synthase
MKILCTICVRKGSLQVKNKNLKKINGKPLVQYTIEQAMKSKLFEHVVVSTDSKQISKLAIKLGAECWFLRPAYLSSSSAPKIPVIKHALLKSEKYFGYTFNILMDLDATSPLRNIEDLKKSLNQFKKENSKTLISVCESRKNPYFNMIEVKNGVIKKVKKNKSSPDITRRQDAPKVYDMNASIYIWKRSALVNNYPLISKKTSIYHMPFERSVDIDSLADFNLVKYFINNKKS